MLGLKQTEMLKCPEMMEPPEMTEQLEMMEQPEMAEQPEEETVMPETHHLQDRALHHSMEIGIQGKVEGSEGFKSFSMRSQLKSKNQNCLKENQEKTLIPGGLWSKYIYTTNQKSSLTMREPLIGSVL